MTSSRSRDRARYVQVQVEMRNMLEQILLQGTDPRGVVRQTVERANRILTEEATR